MNNAVLLLASSDRALTSIDQGHQIATCLPISTTWSGGNRK